MLEKRTEDYLDSNERSVVHAGKTLRRIFGTYSSQPLTGTG